MNNIIQMDESIQVRISPQPKKRNSDTGVYEIYLNFSISNEGINQFETAISTGISVAVEEWGKQQMKGKGMKAMEVNQKLIKYMIIAQLHIDNFRIKGEHTCRQVRDEILVNVKPKITGRAQHGKKVELTAPSYCL